MKLLDQLGQSGAMELLLTGQLIDGREAERIGFVSAAVEAQKVLDEALLRARRVATASPVAVRETKLAALQERFREYRRREEEERIIVARVRASGHQRIGAEAFLQKRKPSYP